MSAEADMWAAAVEQALRYGCAPLDGSDLVGCEPSAAANEWRFLTDIQGGWADSRTHICNMCGLDPDILRREALRRGMSNAARAALMHGEMVAEKRKRKLRPAVWKGNDIDARNAAIAVDFAAGMSNDAMNRKYGLSLLSIKKIAYTHGAKRPADFVAIAREAVVAGRKDRKPERNAEILARAERGEKTAAIARAMGVTPAVVSSVTKRAKKKAGSAVEVRGDSNSRAAGGVGLVSFHEADLSQGSAP